jgi:adenine-specific DNA-methyltransferase
VTAHLIDTADLRKARGAFFTPEPLSRFITDWAIRSLEDRVLEPSCGEAAFLLAAVDRLAALHDAAGPSAPPPHLDGIELHEASAQSARELLRAAGVEANVLVGDFFTLDPTGSYDAVIGNPPYVRYQSFSGDSRALSRKAALRAGVSMTGLASSWAAFTVHAALFLKRGGRLGLVLPAELLTVNYAGSVRAFLMERFARVDLVLFDERVFPGVLEEVVLLLADGYQDGPADHCRVYQMRDVDDLSTPAVPRLWRPDTPDGKWTPSLLPTEVLSVYAALVRGPHFTPLSEWGETTLGMVTGNNRYFALTPMRLTDLRLTASDVIPLSPPGSRHLRRLSFTGSGMAELARDNAPTWLFRPPGEPSKAAWDYIAAGEATDVQHAYKCAVRTPWWRVPYVRPADLLLTYMNADTPRLCSNRARAHHLNSVHGVYLKDGRRRLGMDFLAMASLNSMTLLGAETVGRAYGGGMLKIEPKEADRLPVPSPDLIHGSRRALTALRPRVLKLLADGRLTDAVALVDEVMLVEHLGMACADVQALRNGYLGLMARRLRRGASPRMLNGSQA